MSKREEEERQEALPVADHSKEATERGNVDQADAEVEREASRRSRRSFVVGGIGALAALGGWEWLKTRQANDGVPWPLRRALESNEGLARSYFSSSRLAPVFPREVNKTPRVNGDIGLSDDFDPATWRLDVAGLARPDNAAASNSNNRSSKNSADPFSDETVAHFTLDDIKSLPRVELMTELKCIEGWADRGFWAGARLSDFIAKYPPITRNGNAPDVHNRPDDLVGYVSLATPDGGYYVGLD
nr:hypothetical protein [Pyrinomonadaceae bacterium]